MTARAIAFNGTTYSLPGLGDTDWNGQVNAWIDDVSANAATKTTAQTLTNKTLTAPVINGMTTALGLATTDSTGTPGAATINKPSGKSAIASGAASVVITNSLVAATSRILITPLDLDGTLTNWKAVAGVGAFTVTGNGNAAATWKFSWVVINS